MSPCWHIQRGGGNGEVGAGDRCRGRGLVLSPCRAPARGLSPHHALARNRAGCEMPKGAWATETGREISMGTGWMLCHLFFF